MSYPYTKNVKHITDFKVTTESLNLESKDMRGKPNTVNVLDLNATNLYNLILEVYDLGREHKLHEIKRSLEI